MKVISLLVPSLLLAAGVTLLSVAACQNTDAATKPSGAGGATSSGTGANACAFTITPRPEYTDYAAGTPVNGATPNIRRVRLGLGGTVTAGAPTYADPSKSFAVAWQTDDGTLASDVTWGADPDPTKWDAKNRVGGSTWNTPPGSIQGNGPQRMHEAYVCGLTPATTYYYRVGGGPAGAEVWSDVYPFSTTPAAGDATVKFAITGDSRGEEQNAWQLLQHRVKGQGVTLQLFSGDMINLGPDQGEWEQWLDKAWKDETGMPSALPSILTLAAHGNHDNHTTLFYGNVTLPQDPAYALGAELFFSVDVGPVHVVVFDDFYLTTNQNPEFISSLTDWLEKDLTAAEANRASVPWIITVHHHPEYSSSLHGKDPGVIAVRTFTSPIWDKHHVDLSIAGHDHNYERSKPLTGPAANPTVQTDTKAGTTYLVCAGSGADAYSAGMSPFTDVSRDYKSGGIGLYSILTATKSKLTIEAHTMTAAGDDPVFDTYTLSR